MFADRMDFKTRKLQRVDNAHAVEGWGEPRNVGVINVIASQLARRQEINEDFSKPCESANGHRFRQNGQQCPSCRGLLGLNGPSKVD